MTEQELAEIEARINAATNVQFIVYARTYMPALIAEIKRLRGGLEMLRIPGAGRTMLVYSDYANSIIDTLLLKDKP